MRPARRSSEIRAWKYGSLYVRRASSTAIWLDASRLKNQIPGFSSRVTYVRTLISRKRETNGSGSIPRARRPAISNGVTPTQALPPCSCTSSPSGTCSRTTAVSTRQCANSRSSHDWPITHESPGSGQGRCSVSWSEDAWRAGAWSSSIRGFGIVRPSQTEVWHGTAFPSTQSQIASKGLFSLNRFEQRLEVPVAEPARPVPLDHLEEERRAVLRRLREDLQQIAVIVAVGEDAEPLEVGVVLVDLADAVRNVVVVRVRGDQEDHAAPLQRLDRLDDVRRRHGDVLNARPVVELEVLLDLALALSLGRLVDRELDL